MSINTIFANQEGINFIAFVFSIGLILVGILIGKTISYLLKKISDKADIKKAVRPSFVRLIITVIKWAIYIGFFHLALQELPFDFLGGGFSGVLIAIPAFVMALILIGIGFAIAIYLREVVEDSEIYCWRTLSQYLYYFVLYVTGVYAVNIALVSLDPLIRNGVTLALTTIVVAAITYVIVKTELKK